MVKIKVYDEINIRKEYMKLKRHLRNLYIWFVCSPFYRPTGIVFTIILLLILVSCTIWGTHN